MPSVPSLVPVPLPATAALARATDAGRGGMPAYVTAEQARAVIAAARTTRDRLLLECLWQSGGRVTEVARLRRADVDAREGALVLTNLKQRRRALQRKRVYVSPELVARLADFARDTRVRETGHLFVSREGAGVPLSRVQVWRLVRRASERAGVRVVDTTTGQERPATGLDFRHGAAVHQLRAGVPLSEVSQQLGHARLDTTTVYTRLTDAERRRYADRVTW